MSERWYMCERTSVYAYPPPRCQHSPLPSSSLPSHHVSPWTDRGLISQLNTHFLRLSPSRSHTLLLLLPSVPFSISLPPSIILFSPSLTFMPSISFIALLHFTSTLSPFSLGFLHMTLTVRFSSMLPCWCFTPSLSSLLLFYQRNWPLSRSDHQKYSACIPCTNLNVSSFVRTWCFVTTSHCFAFFFCIMMSPAELSVPSCVNCVPNETMMSNWPFLETPLWLGTDCLLCISGQDGENRLINHCLNCITISRPQVCLGEGPGCPAFLHIYFPQVAPQQSLMHMYEVAWMRANGTCLQIHTLSKTRGKNTTLWNTYCKMIGIFSCLI